MALRTGRTDYGKRGHGDEVLLRLACLTVANTVAVLRLLPMSDRGKDAEVLFRRHQMPSYSASLARAR